jgi:GT2 family glycosyltransferase
MHFMTQSNITTCIGTYNSLPYLKLTIESVRTNEYFKSSPLIVFADGCTDGTNEWLEENKTKYNITMIIEPRCEDSSNGYGMNRCAQEVQTEFINFIHADMYVAPNFDLMLYNRLMKYPGEERVLISSYRFQPNIFHDGKEPDRPGTVMVHPAVFGDMPENFNAESFKTAAEIFASDYSNYTVPKAEGCSFMIRKRDWDYIGGNDLRFKPNGFDDMDLFLRMRSEGYKYETIAASVVYHFAGRGGNGFFGKGLEKRNDSNILGELRSGAEFIKKWSNAPIFDEYGMIKPFN